MTTDELLKLTVETLDRKKGMDIKALKVTDLTVIADYFVIVTGTSPTHIKALSDDLEDKLAEKGKNAKSVEGKATGWIQRKAVKTLISKSSGATPRRLTFPSG